MNITDIKNMVKTLTEPSGVSGNEHAVSQKVKELLSPYAQVVTVDGAGNVTADISPVREGLPVLVLSAHLDETGMVTAFIDDAGFIVPALVGGVDRRVLPAQSVTIFGKRPIPGVICTLPPHVSTENKTIKENEIAIDTGFIKSELEEWVSLGDTISVDSVFSELSENIVSCRALDDRAGAAVILAALDLLRHKPILFNIRVILTVQEEVGERGAEMSAFGANADFVICTDVSFAYCPGEKEWKTGTLGKGVMIGKSPVLDGSMSSELTRIARESGIPFQTEVMSESTGTDADRFSSARGGVKTALLSVPLRYMHTPVETADLRDIENTAKLISAFCCTPINGRLFPCNSPQSESEAENA
jgi:endoglucanase